MTHTAAAYAKMKNRLQTFVCTTSIGPGATNMVTGAACATINRLPLLLLPGDIFARRNVGPVLQQLECGAHAGYRRERLLQARLALLGPHQPRRSAALRAARSHARADLARRRPAPSRWPCRRTCRPRPAIIPRRSSKSASGPFRARSPTAACWRARRSGSAPRKAPLIVAGGGVTTREANEALARFAAQTGIAVGETQAGKGSLPFDHPQQLGAIGVTGTPGANIMARDADLVIGIGTRYSDFTTASKTAFQNPGRPLHQHQRVRARFLQALRHPADRRRARRPRGTRRRARRLPRRRRRTRACVDAPPCRMGAEVDRLYALTSDGRHRPERDRRRAQQLHAAARRGALRRRQPARRPAQTLAHARPQGLSHGVRLLHAWATKSPAASASRWPTPRAKFT